MYDDTVDCGREADIPAAALVLEIVEVSSSRRSLVERDGGQIDYSVWGSEARLIVLLF